MHIRTQREIFRQVVKPHCDDVYDFLQLAQGGRENFLHDIESEFTDKQEEELTKWLKDRLENGFWRAANMAITRDDLEKEFIFWIEKNRGYSLGMGEMGDISTWAEDWARDNGYGYLYED